MNRNLIKQLAGVIALLIVALLIGAVTQIHASDMLGICSAGLPFAFGGKVFLDKDTGGKYGALITKAMDEAGTDPDAKLGAGIKAVGAGMDELTKNSEQWHADTKKAAEDFTAAKNQVTGLSDSVKAFELTMQKFALQMNREKRMAFGDPIQRIVQDREIRELMNAAFRCMLSGGPANEFCTKKHREIVSKALGEDSSPGSTFLRDDIAPMIYDVLSSYGIWNTLAVEPLGTKTTSLPVDTADPICKVVAEGTAASDDTNITGTSVSAVVKQLITVLKVSRQLIADSEYDVVARVLKKFQRATNYRLDYLAFVADGTDDDTNGAFTGLFNFGTAVSAATGHTTMELLDLEDITGLMLTPADAVMERETKWWMHKHILVRMLHIKDANGRPIFLTALEAPTPGALGSILGSPVVTGNVLPKVNTTGSKVMAYGDPESFVIGVRQDFQFDASEHAYFTANQIGYRGIARAAVKGRKATGSGVLSLA